MCLQFQPQLVLVSAGFDAAIGDPKVKLHRPEISRSHDEPFSPVCVCLQGEMCVSPQCFHVLTHMLMSLAEGRLVLALEVKCYDLLF